MVKLSHDNPAKNKWREAWFRFLRKNKNYLIGNPKDWQVVFLPGTEGLEIEVYDRLGIPRENLVGLENDIQRYEKLKKKRLGIRIPDKPMDSLDFFLQTNDKFDIVNLDYEGMLNSKVIKTLETIAGRQLLKEESVFGISTFGRREQPDVKKKYRQSALARFHSDKLLAVIGYSQRGKDLIHLSNEEILKVKGYDKFEDQRDIGITVQIRDPFARGIANLSLPEIYKKDPSFNITQDAAIDIAHKRGEKFENEVQINNSAAVSIARSLSLFRELFYSGIVSSEQAAAILLNLVEADIQRSYIPVKIERYRYVSTASSPMFSDFFLFSQYTKHLDKIRYITENMFGSLNQKDFLRKVIGIDVVDDFSKKQAAKQYHLFMRDMHKLVYRWIVNFKKVEKRIFLGSSAKLPILNGQEYYNHRYNDDKNGILIEDTWKQLVETYKVTKTQLPRFEAHYTMGTYGPQHIKEETKKIKDDKLSIPDKLDLIPIKYWNRLSANSQKRIEYFLEEDLMKASLNNDSVSQLFNELKESKLYKLLGRKDLSDLRFYALFDDIFLEIKDGKIPKSKRILELYENVQKPGWNYKPCNKVQPERSIDDIAVLIETEKPMLTSEIYEHLRFEEGKDDQWISTNYRTKKTNSIRAYKAWVTMKHGKREEEPTNDMAYQVMLKIEDRKSKKQIMEELGLSTMELAGFIAAKKRGAYDNILAELRKKNPVIDSRGVAHFRNGSALETEKGYK